MSSSGRDVSSRTVARIGVDLTPLLPHGENGGSKVLALALLRALFERSPGWDWVLFAYPAGAQDAGRLAGSNVTLRTIDLPLQVAGAAGPSRRLSRGAKSVLPRRLQAGLRILLRDRARRRTVLFAESRRAGLDLVFSPFGSTSLIGRDLPFVAIVYDLLHEVHPEFLERQIVDQRRIETAEMVRKASRVVCASEFSRRAMLATTGIPAERVVVIPPVIEPRPMGLAKDGGGQPILSRYELSRHGYFLYPANSWPHKNHLRLLEAYALLRDRGPGRPPSLVLAGADTGSGGEVTSAVRRLGLEGDVVSPGYVPAGDLAVLLSEAMALVYPSLYEGYGLPTMEAMAVGTPVACSRAASLPEVAGDAALYFDPLSVPDIARALGELTAMDSAERAALVEKGHRRFREHESPGTLASRYLALLGESLPAPVTATAP